MLLCTTAAELGRSETGQFFEILEEERAGLAALKAKYGSIVKPAEMERG